MKLNTLHKIYIYIFFSPTNKIRLSESAYQLVSVHGDIILLASNAGLGLALRAGKVHIVCGDESVVCVY